MKRTADLSETDGHTDDGIAAEHRSTVEGLVGLVGEVAWALAGAVAWFGLMVWLAFAAEMTRDVRIWLFLIVSTALAGFSLRDLTAHRSPRARTGVTASLDER